jgi:hypothetical protein
MLPFLARLRRNMPRAGQPSADQSLQHQWLSKKDVAEKGKPPFKLP